MGRQDKKYLGAENEAVFLSTGLISSVLKSSILLIFKMVSSVSIEN